MLQPLAFRRQSGRECCLGFLVHDDNMDMHDFGTWRCCTTDFREALGATTTYWTPTMAAETKWSVPASRLPAVHCSFSPLAI